MGTEQRTIVNANWKEFAVCHFIDDFNGMHEDLSPEGLFDLIEAAGESGASALFDSMGVVPNSSLLSEEASEPAELARRIVNMAEAAQRTENASMERATLRKSLEEAVGYLESIRREELDGSEPQAGDLIASAEAVLMATQATGSIGDFIAVERAALTGLLSKLDDVQNSCSSDGCESPYAVIDETHLKAAMEMANGVWAKMGAAGDAGKQAPVSADRPRG